MLASQYAQLILDLVAKHGDKEVEKWTPSKGRHTAPAMVLAYRMTGLDGPRGGVGRTDPNALAGFWSPHDNPKLKGEEVFRV